MDNRCILTLSFSLSVLLWSATGAASDVPDGYRRVAHEAGVPAEALYSLSLAESSKKIKPGLRRPWPWTINVAGTGYRYASRQEAFDALNAFARRYPLKRIDVGIAQTNIGWHGHRFASRWAAFEPYTNLRVAAQILRECYDRSPGSWDRAIGCYHHPAGGTHARTYRAIVRRNLNELPTFRQQGGTAPASASVASLVWVDPEQPQKENLR